jgi:hypothetical protein
MIYRVQLSCEIGEDDDIAHRLSCGFSEGPPAAMPTGIRQDDGRVTIEFDRLSERAETDEGPLTEYAPGSELIAALTRFEREHTLLVPLLRALLSFGAARKRAGLRPRHGVELTVVPAQPLRPESLSVRLSDAVPPSPPPSITAAEPPNQS